ncbi:MAG: Asp-tRNA(Asn)/Glu-tRNA(Gln) amidotransferase subunit GatC [Spirochaetales bacterium]
MEITTKLVKHLANLSKLEFTDEEIENFKGEFAKTLSYVDTLQKIDTNRVKSTSNKLNAEFDLREDIVKDSLPQQEILKGAPKAGSGMFAVPKIVE